MDSDLIATLRESVADERVLSAIAAIPRERFVADEHRDRAYENVALPIACQQTISQPLVVARMLELLALEPTDRVLDIGTGSGYHAALLAQLCAHVWSIERHPKLSRRARHTLVALGISNVSCLTGDGSAGLPSRAPFQAINVAAAAADAGALPPLEAQLAIGGRLVAPVGATDQHLVRSRRRRTGIRRERFEPVRFVPLVRGRAR
ncbi:MAG: protein-L-isoaspartate(D-aspartate) O-methyltransferase [Solirubrobacteraceae bacterium]|jgi:protein-L-isoaspartate(D-aspartate) O-methyltransferase|nr:protein-L-isoaspartate(D-aspartate) O-methyltransferase [Solirubrobacteraceae bacterium]